MQLSAHKSNYNTVVPMHCSIRIPFGPAPIVDTIYLEILLAIFRSQKGFERSVETGGNRPATEQFPHYIHSMLLCQLPSRSYHVLNHDEPRKTGVCLKKETRVAHANTREHIIVIRTIMGSKNREILGSTNIPGICPDVYGTLGINIKIQPELILRGQFGMESGSMVGSDYCGPPL